ALDGGGVAIQRVIDLSSGTTLAAAKQVTRGRVIRHGREYSACSGFGATRDGTEFGAGRSFQDDEKPSVLLRGFWIRSERSWLWKLPWQSVDERGFRTDFCSPLSMEAGGRTFWTCFDRVFGAITPGSSSYQVLDSDGDGY